MCWWLWNRIGHLFDDSLGLLLGLCLRRETVNPESNTNLPFLWMIQVSFHEPHGEWDVNRGAGNKRNRLHGMYVGLNLYMYAFILCVCVLRVLYVGMWKQNGWR